MLREWDYPPNTEMTCPICNTNMVAEHYDCGCTMFMCGQTVHAPKHKRHCPAMGKPASCANPDAWTAAQTLVATVAKMLDTESIEERQQVGIAAQVALKEMRPCRLIGGAIWALWHTLSCVPEEIRPSLLKAACESIENEGGPVLERAAWAAGGPILASEKEKK